MLKLKKNRCEGFTLAEILITIGIIGVVAALTIPTIIQNSNSRKFINRFKKTLSSLSQAAINAQAQYDIDYSLLTSVSDNSTCANDTLSGGKYSICGLFNNTLAAQTYLGKYGEVIGTNGVPLYTVNVSSFPVDNFLFFSLADGTYVGFNPNIKGCGVGTGNVITTEMITNGKLVNCLGFIDVNGPTPPNNEVTCTQGATTLSVNTTCSVTNSSMGDIFPIVFHDGSVEPATNASLSAFLGVFGKGTAASNEIFIPNKKISYKGSEYGYKDGVGYIRKDDNGNYVDIAGNTYTKNSNGGYTNGDYVYDKNMNPLRMYKDGQWYDYKANSTYKDDGNGNKIAAAGYLRKDGDNYISSDGTVYEKKSDGRYVATSGNLYYYYSSDLNLVGVKKGGTFYDYNGNTFLHDNGNGTYSGLGGSLYSQDTGTGNYVNNNGYVIDSNFNMIGRTYNNTWYDYKNGMYVHDNGDGTYRGTGGGVYTLNSEGNYQSNKNNKVYDTDFNYIGTR